MACNNGKTLMQNILRDRQNIPHLIDKDVIVLRSTAPADGQSPSWAATAGVSQLRPLMLVDTVGRGPGRSNTIPVDHPIFRVIEPESFAARAIPIDRNAHKVFSDVRFGDRRHGVKDDRLRVRFGTGLGRGAVQDRS